MSHSLVSRNPFAFEMGCTRRCMKKLQKYKMRTKEMNNMILGYHNFVCSNGSWQKKKKYILWVNTKNSQKEYFAFAFLRLNLKYLYVRGIN